ncbi:hypothetical protein QWY77_07880 [Thalassotalea ponticola]|uniref:hypothetical protein n=1 Tax=Thalassotalea ponticola TaxID=1523392 RepID=UPI0025B4759E|nr:hypothetical protein [Thalassotalea ponticola]MDN3652681.1 hypothetical protein [Thalassotalea ponticola]
MPRSTIKTRIVANDTASTRPLLSLSQTLVFVSAVTLSGFVGATPMLFEQETPQLAPAQASADPVVQSQEQQSSDDDDIAETTPTKKRGRTVITLESTFVGDKEQPKVTSIVPWQKAEQMAVNSEAMSQRVKMTFQPLEVDSLKREMTYHAQKQQQ